MTDQQPREETGRVLALAATLWGSVVGIAALEGALGRFEVTSLALLAAFVSLFAVASYFLDPQLRAYAAQWDSPRVFALALACAAALAVALALGSVPFAMFFAPLAAMSIAAAAAAVTRVVPRRVLTSTAPAKSPGVNPAAS